MTRRAFSLLSLLTALSTTEPSRADERGEARTAVKSTEPATETTWYGWQTLIADGAWGVTPPSAFVPPAVGGTTPFGAPLNPVGVRRLRTARTILCHGSVA